MRLSSTRTGNFVRAAEGTSATQHTMGRWATCASNRPRNALRSIRADKAMAELCGTTHVTRVACIDPELCDGETLGPAFGKLLCSDPLGNNGDPQAECIPTRSNLGPLFAAVEWFQVRAAHKPQAEPGDPPNSAGISSTRVHAAAKRNQNAWGKSGLAIILGPHAWARQVASSFIRVCCPLAAWPWNSALQRRSRSQRFPGR